MKQNDIDYSKQQWMDRFAPSISDLEELAHRSVEALPEPFRSIAGSISIIIEDLPSTEIMADLESKDPYEITGMYVGECLTEQSYLDQHTGLNCIYLYRLPILDEWAERGTVTLGELICHIVVHEVAHHIGLSDADIAQIDRWWE